ncbi:unnamed protein product, partial [marine sediment metagenome]
SLTLYQKVSPRSPLPGGNPLALYKESTSELSDENKRSLLQTALTDEYQLKKETPIPSGVYVEDIFEDYLIYNVNGQAYKASYTLAEDGTATFGEPEKVIAQKVYEPMEALQTKYSEVIKEAGRRNASLDSTRLKKIVELCQELLSSEEPEEDKIKKATKEADKTLAWLKEQAAVKTEEGVQYPASAFAYTPDLNDPTTWMLRLFEGEEVTKSQLSKASAFLSPGGYKGQKVVIKESDLPSVKRRIRFEYRKIGVDSNDMPKWVKEVETREEIRNYIPLTEAKFDKGRATVIVIKPGFNVSEDR